MGSFENRVAKTAQEQLAKRQREEARLETEAERLREEIHDRTERARALLGEIDLARKLLIQFDKPTLKFAGAIFPPELKDASQEIERAYVGRRVPNPSPSKGFFSRPKEPWAEYTFTEWHILGLSRDVPHDNIRVPITYGGRGWLRLPYSEAPLTVTIDSVPEKTTMPFDEAITKGVFEWTEVHRGYNTTYSDHRLEIDQLLESCLENVASYIVSKQIDNG